MRISFLSLALCSIFMVVGCSPYPGVPSLLTGDRAAIAEPLTQCHYTDAEIKQINRLPSTALSREIMVQSQRKTYRISTIDGYRIFYGQPNNDPFVKFHIEVSHPNMYEKDKAYVLLEMNDFLMRQTL